MSRWALRSASSSLYASHDGFDSPPKTHRNCARRPAWTAVGRNVLPRSDPRASRANPSLLLLHLLLPTLLPRLPPPLLALAPKTLDWTSSGRDCSVKCGRTARSTTNNTPPLCPLLVARTRVRTSGSGF